MTALFSFAHSVAVSSLVLLFLFSGSSAEADHLFGGSSGFDRGAVVRVWAADNTRVEVNRVVAPWNTLAGYELLKKVNLESNADVKFKRDTVTWVQAFPDYLSPFTRAVVWVSSADVGDTHTMRHEIGHALGFADHVTRSQLSGRVNPKVCDDPSHKLYSMYSGVMSYCSWADEAGWFGAGDRAMLVAAGYTARTGGQA